MKIFSTFKKIRTQGFWRTFELLFNRYVPASIFRYSKGDIFEFDMQALASLANVQEDHEFEVRDVRTEAERERLRQVTWSTVPLETTRNDIGYAVFRKGTDEIVGGVWGGVGSFIEESLAIQFQFNQQQVWLYCAFIDKTARGKGVYKKLISFAVADLQRRGFRQALGIVQPWNRVSRRMHEKHSTRICGRMSAIRIFSRVWVFQKGDISIDRNVVTQIDQPAQVEIGMAEIAASI